MTIIGIDPGMTGAIAILSDAATLYNVYDMPTFKVKKGAKTKSHINVYELANILRIYGGAQAVIEDVHAMPRDGSVQAFQFGVGLGSIHGSCGALELPMALVTPQKWKKHFKLTADKEEARQLACRRFPSQADLFKRKMDAGRAEAALIALYHHETTR